MTDDKLRAALERALATAGGDGPSNSDNGWVHDLCSVEECWVAQARAALAASATDEGHVHEWERGVHMAAAFGVDGRTYACAICGIPRLAVSAPDEGPKSAWQQFDEEWRAEHAASATDEPTKLPIYCTGGCDVCRDYAEQLGVPLIVGGVPLIVGSPDYHRAASATDEGWYDGRHRGCTKYGRHRHDPPASATDEGPPEGTRLVLVTDELFQALGADKVEWGDPDERGWYVPTVTVARPAAPALDEERLAKAMRFVYDDPDLFIADVTDNASVPGAWAEIATALAREYAALSSKEPTE